MSHLSTATPILPEGVPPPQKTATEKKWNEGVRLYTGHYRLFGICLFVFNVQNKTAPLRDLKSFPNHVCLLCFSKPSLCLEWPSASCILLTKLFFVLWPTKAGFVFRCCQELHPWIVSVSCSLEFCSNLVCWYGVHLGTVVTDDLLLTLDQQLVTVPSELTLCLWICCNSIFQEVKCPSITIFSPSRALSCGKERLVVAWVWVLMVLLIIKQSLPFSAL